MRALRSSYALLFGFGGRIPRATFWWTALGLGAAFLLALPLIERALGPAGVVGMDLFSLWILAALSAKRLRDRGRSPWALLWVAVPLLGLLFLFVEVGLRRGNEGENQYGPDPRERRRGSYATVESADENLVEEVTRLYPTPVFAVATPTDVEELKEAIRRTNGPISIGGGRFSMGGQVASPDSLHIDMRRMNRVLRIDLQKKTIRVQAGIRWCDIQRVIDPHDLSVMIMQTYANFTVGGSLSVNCHGRYVGLGPIVLSARSILLVLASGEEVEASPEENAELFYAAIGGYGAVGVIAEAELQLTDNCRVEQVVRRVPTEGYVEHFQAAVRNDKEAVFHNGDLYVPGFDAVNVVTWVRTKKAVTTPDRLMEPQRSYPLFEYLFWSVSESFLGKWRRRYLIEPLFYLKERVHHRNYEAGYDVGELEPASRSESTYVLQEYFVPIDEFSNFVREMKEILIRHRVNVLNVSIRHALPDPGTYLAWAREECFAFVLYYKQRTRRNAKNRVAVWTRELIDAAIACRGAYYLPYQAHATRSQMMAAYPRAKELFALKRKLDPGYRLRNVLWDAYYAPTLKEAAEEPAEPAEPAAPTDEFHAVFADLEGRDDFYHFLRNIFHLHPEDRLYTLIEEATEEHEDPRAIYRQVQERLPEIKPFLSELTYALPSLRKQQAEMLRQTLLLAEGRARFEGMIEIGSNGRYASVLKGPLRIGGEMTFVHDHPPSYSPPDILDRRQITPLGRHLPLDDYAPIPEKEVPDRSCDLVTCYIGLHHIEPPKVAPFLASIWRVLRPGGLFVVRDHDVTDARMDAFVALAHSVFNLGTGESLAFNEAERRHFAPVATWVRRIEAAGFKDLGHRLLQEGDPTLNVLMAFERLEEVPAPSEDREEEE